MKNKILKIILVSIGTVVLLGLIAFVAWVIYFFFLIGNSCGNEILESVSSPDGSKKVVVFVRNCGATTDWATEASVTNANEIVTDGDLGNLLRISPNHGQAWPLAIKGWPIIKAKWDSPNSISLHYSKDSEIFLQDENVNGMDIRFFPITKEFIETENLEIR